MRNNLLKQYLYINWKKEGQKVYMSIDDFKELHEAFKQTRSIAKSNTKREDFRDEDTYTYMEKGVWHSIYYREDKKYITAYCNIYDDNVNNLCKAGEYKNPGLKSRQIVDKLFKDYNDCTALKAFGYCDRKAIHKCIPKSFYYINEKYSGKLIHHVGKADFSSNYPSNAIGDLPDWHNHLLIPGTQKPTKDYPFAFYINSGHIAEYNRFDSHDWLQHELSTYVFKIDQFEPIDPDQDVTILCKKSDYKLDSVINKLYDMKEHGESIDGIEAKLILNSAIGWMHRANVENTAYRLDHIAAITIARATQNMLIEYNKLKRYNVDVLQIIVDAIIYKAKGTIGVKEKSLGAFVQEVVDSDFIMTKTNAYMFFKDDKCIQCKHGAYNADIYTDKPEDIFKWRKVNNGKKETSRTSD